ncbi:MAG TPA: hypothetical protein EYN66_21285 [Myxococcales bacterium]|nr:hypothetical protein [Myxococcales bacterium]
MSHVLPDGQDIEQILEAFWMSGRKPDVYPGLYEDLVQAYGPEDAFRLKYPSHGTGTQQRERERLKRKIVVAPTTPIEGPFIEPLEPFMLPLSVAPLTGFVEPPERTDIGSAGVPPGGWIQPKGPDPYLPLPFVPPIEKQAMANIPTIVPQQVSLAGIIGGVQTVAGWITGATGGGPVATMPPPGCPPGYKLENGVCKKLGVIGAIQQIIPGGQTGTVAPGAQIGQAVMGQYGPALVPTELASTISKCITGMVLGKDGLCYNKRDITNKERLWPRGTRPLLSGGDRKTLRKARSIENQLGRLGMIPPRAKKKRKKLVKSC